MFYKIKPTSRSSLALSSRDFCFMRERGANKRRHLTRAVPAHPHPWHVWCKGGIFTAFLRTTDRCVSGRKPFVSCSNRKSSWGSNQTNFNVGMSPSWCIPWGCRNWNWIIISTNFILFFSIIYFILFSIYLI